MKEPTSIEIRIRSRLKEKGINISTLAKDIGVSRVALYHLFRGNYSRDMLNRVSRRLEIPAHRLIMPLSEEEQTLYGRVLEAYRAAPASIREAVDLLLGVSPPANGTSRPTVIVVDDLEENVEFIRRCLRKEFDVKDFTNPFEALEAIKDKSVDAVVSDQRMPGMTGTELLTEVASLGKPTIRMIVSAYTDNAALMNAINEAKADAFLTKPFHPDELRVRLRQLLSLPEREALPQKN